MDVVDKSEDAERCVSWRSLLGSERSSSIGMATMMGSSANNDVISVIKDRTFASQI